MTSSARLILSSTGKGTSLDRDGGLNEFPALKGFTQICTYVRGEEARIILNKQS